VNNKGKDLQFQVYYEALKQREIEILELIGEGSSNGEIANKLHLTQGTVKWYNNKIFSKLGVKNRTQAIKVAIENDLMSIEKQGKKSKVEFSNNLPHPLTSYVERGNEINEIKQLLTSNRLVTLTGPGGSGKTRLALKVANEIATKYRNGVWQIELAPINDPSLMIKELANIFRVPENTNEELIETLNRFLQNENLLILMDNFEHMLDSAPIIGKILEEAPEVSFLVTSRERLSLYGEQEHPVFPLALPDLEARLSDKDILKTEAVNLFVQRARASQPNLKLNKDEIKDIVQICIRLDGLPLGIELAASQIKIFPPANLLKRLMADIGSLPPGPRNLPARQKTLNATIAWSYQLLNDDQKRVFDRHSVFSDGAIIEAIEMICDEEASKQISEIMVNLVEKNLVIATEHHSGEMRFTMLETIREYSKQMFLQNQPVEEITKRHAIYFADLAEKARPFFIDAGQRYWFIRIKAEFENIRKVLAWSFESDQNQFGLRIVVAMKNFWYFNGYPLEGIVNGR